uniref:STEAP family member 4 n=1 Tax=Sander lucioperca TaxID=283035 RepID=A0A8C9XZB5_SANLU
MKLESVSVHPLGTAAAPMPEMLCIFGTGDLGHSLVAPCLRELRYNTWHNIALLVMNHAAATQSASLIFICVHREHYEFLETMASHLKGKVLVDLSNNLKKDMYPEANARWTNSLLVLVISWYLLTITKIFLLLPILNITHTSMLQVYLCGNSAEAQQAVADVATKLGLTVLDKGSLSAARELEDLPLQLFTEWRLPLRVALGLTAFFFFYLLIRDVVYAFVEQRKDISFRIMVSLANKVFPIVSLIMLSLCYLPGVIAAFLQLYRGTKYRRFPDWLDRWMLCRKQMGLIALTFAFLHVIYTFMTSLRYAVRHKLISLMKNNKTTPFYFDNTEAWGQDSFFVLGILGFFLYVLLGLTSLPSVGGCLSWREFSFIQSKLGHLTLFICTSHCYIYGWNKFLRPSTYKWYTPPGYMLCLIVPSVVLVLKALVLLLCMDRTLTRIQQGWEMTQPREEMREATNL